MQLSEIKRMMEEEKKKKEEKEKQLEFLSAENLRLKDLLDAAQKEINYLKMQMSPQKKPTHLVISIENDNEKSPEEDHIEETKMEDCEGFLKPDKGKASIVSSRKLMKASSSTAFEESFTSVSEQPDLLVEMMNYQEKQKNEGKLPSENPLEAQILNLKKEDSILLKAEQFLKVPSAKTNFIAVKRAPNQKGKWSFQKTNTVLMKRKIPLSSRAILTFQMQQMMKKR